MGFQVTNRRDHFSVEWVLGEPIKNGLGRLLEGCHLLITDKHNRPAIRTIGGGRVHLLRMFGNRFRLRRRSLTPRGANRSKTWTLSKV